MSLGGKTSTSTQKIELDPRIETAAAEAAAAGLRTAAMPYRANRGVTVAAFSPQQMAAFEGANAAASAFGLPAVAGGVPGGPVTGDYLPSPETAAGGYQGYSVAPVMDQNIDVSTDEQYRNAVQQLLMSYADAADRVSPIGGEGSGREGEFSQLLENMPLFNMNDYEYTPITPTAQTPSPTSGTDTGRRRNYSSIGNRGRND